MESMMALDDENINGGYARVRALSKLPCARDNCIGVGALSRHRRRRGLGAIVCDGIARETVEGRGAVSGSLAGMFPARRLPPRQIFGESASRFLFIDPTKHCAWLFPRRMSPCCGPARNP